MKEAVMDSTRQAEKGATFRALHDRTRILVLPNAWDAVTARVFEAAGFPAVATTSAAVAWALGFPDGQLIPRDEAVAAVRRITSAVTVPVSADMVAGFGSNSKQVAETVRMLIDVGAVGMNLEDSDHDGPSGSLVESEAHVAKIHAARAAADGTGIPFVINARTDVYLAGIGEPAERFDHAVGRASLYHAAGADSLFVPGVRDAETIGRLARALPGPLNVLAGPGMPAVPELQALGVARVSVGSGPAAATLSLLRRIAEELAGPGTFTGFTAPGNLPYAEWNRLMESRPH
jgi:2-methylisocitrate lyase-like PEP mutase family enzyme